MSTPRPPDEPVQWDHPGNDPDETLRPEFIIIEDDRQEEKNREQEDNYYKMILKLSEAQFGLPSRIMSLILFFFFGIMTILFSFIFLFCVICKVLTLGQVESVEQLWKTVSHLFGKLFLYSFASLVGVIAPRMGFGLVLLHLIFHHEKMDSDPLARMMDDKKGTFYN